jgi:membrane protease subunit HflK
MSEPRDPIDPIEGFGETAPAETAPRRAASATFTPQRDQAAQALSLDPAQQSLAEALRITFFILRLGIGVLIVLFLLSGAKQVKESERGVRLTFGAVVNQDVPPGLHIGWPYPIGEFVTVATGQETLDLRDSFYPQLTGGQRAQPLDQLSLVARLGLVPGRDGSLVTADGNIVHVRPTVVYRRQRPGEYVRNVLPGTEPQLVRTAVERAVTTVFATLTLDQALKQGSTAPAARQASESSFHYEGDGHDHSADEMLAPSPANPETPEGGADGPEIIDVIAGPSSTIATRVRLLAQAALDDIGTGIVIEEVALRDITPPLSIRSSFAQVQSAQSDAEQARERADRERRERLSQVAGQAADILLRQIDAYEKALELNDPNAENIIANIDSLLQGEPVEIDGQRYVAMISGEVTNQINSARRYRTEIESRYRSFSQTFAAKLEQYRTNPGLLVTREWTEALSQFFARQEVEVNFLPPLAIAELLINRDPDIARARDTARNLQQLTGTLEGREQEFNRIQRARDRQRDIAEGVN